MTSAPKEVGQVPVEGVWDRLMLGDTRPAHPSALPPPGAVNESDAAYPLLAPLRRFRAVREAALAREGRAQREFPASNGGWCVTLFIVRGRALHRVLGPWALVTLHAVVYTALQELVYDGAVASGGGGDDDDGQPSVLESWSVFFSFVLNPTLAFLLVFRLQRAADRYWMSRFYWGDLIAKARTLVSGLVVHGRNSAEHRDHAVRWLNAYAVAIMELLRGRRLYDGDMFAGILTLPELRRLERSPHPPLHAMTRLRGHLRAAFPVAPDAATPVATAVAHAQTLHRLERQLDIVQDCCGGMERIKATPLPIVYVSHLRTFLIVALLLFPYIYGPSWRWTTIPLVALAAFAWLGIDAAAEECEAPFAERSVNALDMDTYCLGLMATTLQELQDAAEDDDDDAAETAAAPPRREVAPP